ncbi:MAG: hypothetical protein SGPRY_009167 [Prymnesium sp.]
MSNALPGYSSHYLPKPPPPLAVTGYTGKMPGLSIGCGTVFGTPVPTEHFTSPCFPDINGAPPRSPRVVESMRAGSQAFQQGAATPGMQVPGYAGHLSGTQNIVGSSHAAFSRSGAVHASCPFQCLGTPGMLDATHSVVPRNLRPDVVMPHEPPRTKSGYDGHLPGKHFSTNFGKPFASAAVELLATHGKPVAGGIGDPGRPFIADTDSKLSFPRGHLGRPKRSQIYIAGYAGFRPRSTPL